MTRIVLDTNIWIYLTKETFFELWVRFRDMKNNGEIDVIINDIIFKEWERNKAKTIKDLSESIKSEYKSAKNLLNFLKEEEKDKFIEALAPYKMEDQRVEIAVERVEEVENFMKSCTIISTNDDQKLFIANLAINKIPPFQNNKNNFNDALIVRNIYEHTKSEMPFQYDLIYVSNNPDDFINKQTGKLHGDLFDGLSNIRLKNVTQLGEALKLAPELIEDFDEWLEYHLNWEAEMNFEIRKGK